MTKITTMIAAAVLGVMQARADERVTVYIQDGVVVPQGTLNRAESLANRMFAKAGVRINWRIGRPDPEAITVGISNFTPRGFHPGALALALPYDCVHITVFYDRISKTVAPDLAPALLAHVLVHEITHILQGIDRHSETGVMKAHWEAADYARMLAKPLPFTPWDVELIHEGLQSRGARVSARSAIRQTGARDPLQ